VNEPTPAEVAKQASARQECLCGTAAAHCGQPASVHILQTDGHPTMSCPTHVEHWAGRPHLDFHPIGASCGHPGKFWTWSRPGAPGACVDEVTAS
jgi:hypothetical protein